MKQFGLIGYPLSHSFSKKYFTDKFQEEGIRDCNYELYPIASIEELPDLLKKVPNLVGLNVTIPYKEQVLPFLEELDEGAAEVGAVNTIKIIKGKLSGYNTDVYGFEQSLQNFVIKNKLTPIKKALILGTGGAAKAVAYVLKKLEIDFHLVSRKARPGVISYEDINFSVLDEIQLIVNTTPLGMAPKIVTAPNIPYEALNAQHLLFDLVYNPKKTVFLSNGEQQGSYIINGYEMLIGQAEKSWQIWTQIHD